MNYTFQQDGRITLSGCKEKLVQWLRFLIQSNGNVLILGRYFPSLLWLNKLLSDVCAS